MVEELYNLLISGSDDVWESDSYRLDKSRFLEYTEKDLKDRFCKLDNVAINEIINYPCIFAYEDYWEKDASIGYITDIIVRQGGIKITFEKVKKISPKILSENQFEFNIGDWELNRTHWAIKKVNLYKELQSLGINLNPIKTNQIIDITKHNFDVAFTFAGESRDLVEQVKIELEKIIERNQIFYDNNYTSQLARPSLDSCFFM